MHAPSPAAGRYRLVAFDFDGTLADTFPWFCSVLNGVADRYGFRRVAPDETERLRGLEARAILSELAVPAWKLPLIARHMRGLFARDSGALRLFPGVPAMLADLDRAGFALALVSSNSEANVRRVLGGEAARFRHYACGAAMFGKARRLAAVARRSGLAPGTILAVGDEIRDLDAARQAGCGFAGVTWGYTRADALAARGPDHLFGEPGAVARALTAR